MQNTEDTHSGFGTTLILSPQFSLDPCAFFCAPSLPLPLPLCVRCVCVHLLGPAFVPDFLCIYRLQLSLASALRCAPCCLGLWAFCLCWAVSGEGMTNIKEMVAGSIEVDPVLNDANHYDLTREEARERSMAKIAQVVNVIKERNRDVAEAAAAEGPPAEGQKKRLDSPESEEDRSSSRAGSGKAFETAFYSTLGSLDASWAIRIGVQFGLFQGALLGSGSEAQIKQYAMGVQEWSVIGCFAMTEMGHGSYLQGLETTATYDRTTQEFIVHSPTITSTKWWIGLAGQTATHAAVFAKLILDGKDVGIQTFIVPVRSPQTGLAVEDVEVGDMGSKMGRNGLDNGWIRFNHKRIPRENMLCRWAQVSAEGVFTPPPSKQISYNALIGTRVELFGSCSLVLKKALTIAIRYSLVRRQFLRKDDPTGKSGETKLLDYPTHQAALFPILAHTFALHFTAVQTQAKADAMLKDLSGNLSSLPELHATSSGLKAVGTWYANDAIETCRQTLGGMGYSSYAGLASMRADWAVMCTWEGDNTVLSLQCARFLVKQAVNISRGKTPSGVTRYIAEADANAKVAPGLTDQQWRDPAFQLRSLHHRTARKIREVTRWIDEEAKRSKVSYAVAAERLSVECMSIAKLHCYVYMLECFNEGVARAPKELQQVLALLRDLFALGHMESSIGDFLEDGYLGAGHAASLRGLLRRLLLEVRPHACNLVDSFNIPDFVVDSALGRADGDVYNKIFEMIKAAPRAMGPPSYFDKLIRPLTDPDYKPPAEATTQ